MRVHATVCLMVLTATAVYSSAGEVLSPVAVASLGGHTADAWVSGSKCIDSTLAEKIKCNLGVYESAISRSSVEGAKLIALPEAYGVMGHPKDENKYFEEMASFVGNNPCGNATLSPISPQQYHLSCFAKKYRMSHAPPRLTLLRPPCLWLPGPEVYAKRAKHHAASEPARHTRTWCEPRTLREAK